MSAAEIRMHLRELQLERLEAESYGLDRDQPHLQDLESERIGYQRALVAAALDEILTLRSELSQRQ